MNKLRPKPEIGDRPIFLIFLFSDLKGPYAALLDIDVREGVVSADDPLIEPKFYISPHVKDWIEDYLTEVCSRHPHWTISI
jgi:hypothetical protein